VQSNHNLAFGVGSAFGYTFNVNGVAVETILNTGQLQLNKYINTSAFTGGTTLGLFGFDGSGNVYPIIVSTGLTLSGQTLTASGGSLLTRQSITSGTSATGSTGNLIVTFNFPTTTASFAFTMPASPTDQQVVEFEGGGTLAYPNYEITTLTVSPNSGQSINGTSSLNTFQVGEYAKYKWNNSLSSWMREQ
jgi:hypothetical protein